MSKLRNPPLQCVQLCVLTVWTTHASTTETLSLIGQPWNHRPHSPLYRKPLRFTSAPSSAPAYSVVVVGALVRGLIISQGSSRIGRRRRHFFSERHRQNRSVYIIASDSAPQVWGKRPGLSHSSSSTVGLTEQGRRDTIFLGNTQWNQDSLWT